MSNSQLESLNKIFDGKFLRIPDYQRGYAWGKEQIDCFWDDLMSLEEEHIHYTGVLTLEPVTETMKDEKIEFWKTDNGAYQSKEAFYIVDGQQRITTSIILIKVLLDSVKDEEWFGDEKVDFLREKYIRKSTKGGIHQYFFGYTADNPSYEFLKTKVFGDTSTSNDNKETLYTANLEKAKDIFELEVSKLTTQEKELVFKKLTENFKFNVYEIADDLDVFVAFETMNNRGKPLSNLELLKNRLIYLSTKFHDKTQTEEENKLSNDALRTDINNCWKTVYEYLGKNKNNVLPDDTFLKNHWIMYHDYSRQKGNDYIVDLLKERYTTKKINNDEVGLNLTVQDVRAYVLSLQESVKHWYYLYNPSEAKYDDTIKLWLDKLYRLGHGAFAPLLMAILSKSDYEMTEFCKLLALMERYVFLVFNVSQRRSNTGDSEFYGYARKYFKSEVSIAQIIGEEEFDSSKCSGLNWWLTNYIDLKAFHTYMSDKFKNRDGYYSWSGLPYFLFEYELYLRKETKNSELKITWDSYVSAKNDRVSIEHIFPQTLTDEYWQKQIVDFNEAKIKQLTNALGNLVPLSTSKNSKLQNYCFSVKKGGNDEFAGFKNGSYSEQKINEKSDWGVIQIEDRGRTLIKFLIDHWQIPESQLVDDVEKKLLFSIQGIEDDSKL